MGYYVEHSLGYNRGKVGDLISVRGAQYFIGTWKDVPEDKAVIVVMDNGMFEVAGFAYDEKEFNTFRRPEDRRPKTFLLMDRKLAEELSGYPKK
jgi:hypothetical protein